MFLITSFFFEELEVELLELELTELEEAEEELGVSSSHKGIP